METMPNIQARIVNYDRQGTQVTQQRFYEVTEVNGDHKWRQIKNVNAREALADAMENTFSAVSSAETAQPVMPAALEVTTLEEAKAAEAAITRSRRTEPLRVNRTATTVENSAVVAANPTELTAYDHTKGLLSWAKNEVTGVAEKLNGAKRIVLRSALGVLALGSTFGISSAGASGDSEGLFHRAAAVAQEASTSTSTTEAPDTEVDPAVQAAIDEMNDTLGSLIERAEAPLSQAELEATYGGESTGEHTAREIGFFNIDPANPEQSLQNLYSELRVNSDAQAFWNACLDSGTPSYEVCVENPNVIGNANRLSTEYRAMTLEQKAETAEALIDKFEEAEFNGITLENGTYKTVAVGSNGEFVASTNTRYEDPRMNFTFTIDGTEYDVQMRSCVQVTEQENPTPVPETPVTPPVEEETPPPAEETPEETTTTTEPEEETTTTTEPEEETTTTTEPEEETTTTTEPEEETTTTSTPVTLPKPDPTYPAGENPNSTTVTVGEPTPPEPTTSTVPEASTSSTASVDTSVSTTAPEGPIDPMSIDTVTVSELNEREAKSSAGFWVVGSIALAVASRRLLKAASRRTATLQVKK